MSISDAGTLLATSHVHVLITVLKVICIQGSIALIYIQNSTLGVFWKSQFLFLFLRQFQRRHGHGAVWFYGKGVGSVFCFNGSQILHVILIISSIISRSGLPQLQFLILIQLHILHR